MKEKNAVKKGVKRRIIQVFITLIIQIGLTLLSAGKLNWPIIWILLAVYMVILAINFLVMRKDPELIAERATPKENVKQWDKTITGVTAPVTLILLLICGLDERFSWSPDFSFWLQITGLVFIAAGQLIFTWSMSANRFFSTLVRLQDERGHQVAKGGPYRYIRHPGYFGYILFTLATPVCLGSLWGFVPAGIITVLMVIRTSLEDKMLLAELSGYEDYATTVQYRLIHGLW